MENEQTNELPEEMAEAIAEYQAERGLADDDADTELDPIEDVEAPVEPEEEASDEQVEASDEEKPDEAKPDLDAREAALVEREESLAAALQHVNTLAQTQELFDSDPVGTIKNVIAALAGIDPTDEETVRARYDEIFQEMVNAEVGVTNKEDSKVRSLEKKFADYKREQERKAAEAAAAQRIEAADSFMAENLEKFPFLTAAKESAAGSLLYEYMKAEQDDGRSLTEEQAAQQLNDHFKTEAEKYRHLLAQTSAGQKKTPTSKRQKTLSSKNSEVPARKSKDYDPRKREEFVEDVIEKMLS